MNKTVTLIDGRQVDNTSEEWRHECEARAIAALPTLAERRAWLQSLAHKRGTEDAERIKATMKKLWEAKSDGR